MFQGPEQQTTDIEREFLQCYGGKRAKADHREVKEQGQNIKGQKEQKQEQHLEVYIENESTDIAVTKNQITQLHQFILGWEKTRTPQHMLTTGICPVRELQNETSEERTINEFKRDILNYLNQRGLQSKNI